jgi:hypothetical protein
MNNRPVKRNEVKIPLSHDRLEAVSFQYSQLLQAYQPENDHDRLLFECMIELSEKIGKTLLRDQGKYTLTLTSREALAFYQLWNQVDLSHDPYSRVIINSMIAEIHKASIDPRRSKVFC